MMASYCLGKNCGGKGQFGFDGGGYLEMQSVVGLNFQDVVEFCGLVEWSKLWVQWTWCGMKWKWLDSGRL